MPERSVINPAVVAGVVGQGGAWSRLSISKALGRKKTSHVINQIELAVSIGYIKRVVGSDGVRDCWLYTVEPELF